MLAEGDASDGEGWNFSQGGLCCRLVGVESGSFPPGRDTLGDMRGVLLAFDTAGPRSEEEDVGELPLALDISRSLAPRPPKGRIGVDFFVGGLGALLVAGDLRREGREGMSEDGESPLPGWEEDGLCMRFSGTVSPLTLGRSASKDDEQEAGTSFFLASSSFFSASGPVSETGVALLLLAGEVEAVSFSFPESSDEAGSLLGEPRMLLAFSGDLFVGEGDLDPARVVSRALLTADA